MSEDDENLVGGLPRRAVMRTERVVFQDEMHKVRRIETTIDVTKLSDDEIASVLAGDLPKFDPEIERWILVFSEKLAQLGYPCACALGFVTETLREDAGRCDVEWVPSTDDFIAIVNGIASGVAPIRGFDFIARYAIEKHGLTEVWQWAHLLQLAFTALQEADPISRERQKGEIRTALSMCQNRRHLPEVRFARSRRESEAQGRCKIQSENADRHQEKMENERLARRFADEISRQRPALKTPNAVAELVAKRLREEHGIKSTPETVRRRYLRGWKPPR